MALAPLALQVAARARPICLVLVACNVRMEVAVGLAPDLFGSTAAPPHAYPAGGRDGPKRLHEVRLVHESHVIQLYGPASCLTVELQQHPVLPVVLARFVR